MTLCEKEEYRGLTINVYYDDDYDNNPRDWSNVATFVCEYRQYNLGDIQNIQDAVNELYSSYVSSKAVIDYFVKTRHAKLIAGEEDDGSDHYYEYETKVCGEMYKHCISADSSIGDDEIAGEMEDELDLGEKLQLIEESGEVVMLPISMYEHSGITLWLGSKDSHFDSQWDCSSIGFAYVEKNTAEEEGMLDPGEKYKHDWKEWAYAMMEGEMQTYDQFVRGEVYGYMIEDENGEEATDSNLCGCWGFIGDDGKEDMLSEAKANIDSYLERKRNTRQQNMKMLVENISAISSLQFTDGNYIYRIAKDLFGFDYIERVQINKSVVRDYAEIGFSSLDDEILEDMVHEIKSRQNETNSASKLW